MCGSSGSLSSLPIQQNQLSGSGVTATIDINNRKTNSLHRDGGSPAPTYNNSYDNSPGHCNSNGYMLMSPGIDINRRYVFTFNQFLVFCVFLCDHFDDQTKFYNFPAARVHIVRHQV